jgi:hypothetical protein
MRQHTSQVAMAVATDYGFEILSHPPYFPDLASSDFYLFPKLKTKLRGRRFESNEDVMKAAMSYLKTKKEGLNKLEHRRETFIDVEGDYIHNPLEVASQKISAEEETKSNHRQYSVVKHQMLIFFIKYF